MGLYTAGNPLEKAMRTIITHWSIISGRDIKAGKVAPPDAVTAIGLDSMPSARREGQRESAGG